MPVLSKTSVRSRLVDSRAPASRTRIPASAPRPSPTASATGVARPSAQGQATTRIAIVWASALATRGSGPASRVNTATASAKSRTAGTKRAAIVSASRAIGAFVDWARSTRAIIFPSTLSAPVAVARMVSEPLATVLPPISGWPALRSSGRDSPLTADSSMLAAPSTTTPSTGIRSPALTSSRSPTRMLATERLDSTPSRRTRARVGRSAASARSASPARRRARPSISRPSRTKPRTIGAISR